MNRPRDRRPALAARCVALFALGLVACSELGGVGGARARNLILITIDTWRGDHFLSERGGVPLTPELSALAQRAVRFVDTTSVGTQTSPGVAGILTGLLPHRSGVVTNSHVLPAIVPTLASRLREAGFVSAAWVANPVLRAGFGFDRGFDRYELVARGAGEPKARAGDVVRAALAWLDGRPSRSRFLLWVHLMDPHGPYVPPDDVRAMFPIDRFEAPAKIALLPRGDDSGRGGIPFYQWNPIPQRPRDGRDYAARYAAEIRYLDRELGRLLVRLERDGLLEDSAVILSSDHGEALAGENGFYFSHGNAPTQDQVAVPLLVYYPGCRPGAVVSRPVSTTDILPTALAILGLPAPEDVDGRNLLEDGPSVVMSETASEVALRDGRLKLRSKKQQRASPRLFDLAADPGEKRPKSVDAERMRTLQRRLRDLRSRPQLAPSISRFDLDEGHRRELEALGYLSPVPGQPRDGGGGPR